MTIPAAPDRSGWLVPLVYAVQTVFLIGTLLFVLGRHRALMLDSIEDNRKTIEGVKSLLEDHERAEAERSHDWAVRMGWVEAGGNDTP
jgi:hypothetical protein